MPSVGAKALGFSYSDRVKILENVTFRLNPGWHGLVGANGMGKTTLARLIAGELVPTTGRLWLEPTQALVVLCPQEQAGLTDALTRFAKATDRESRRQRGLWGLSSMALADFDRLSPGEQKRWQLAAALSKSPDVLIVDEPTNHLDEDGRDYLLYRLKQYRGIGIVISHDRELLDNLTTSTIRLHDASVSVTAENYTRASQQWQAETARFEAHRRQLCDRQAQIAERIHVTTSQQKSAQKQRSARSRMKNIHDHDGSSFARTDRAANGEARLSRKLTVLAGELERAIERVPAYVVDKTLGHSVFVNYVPAPKRALLTFASESLCVENRTLLRNVSIVLDRDARVHLKGPNGAGKTTLLRALLAQAGSVRDKILYLPQELGEGTVERLNASLFELDPEIRGRILSILAALGVDPERVLGSARYSPGEARKLELAFGLGTHAWALVLDEPTNHLDLPSIERLETALTAYPGALLIVSHDETFARRCTREVWQLRHGRLET